MMVLETIHRHTTRVIRTNGITRKAGDLLVSLGLLGKGSRTSNLSEDHDTVLYR